MTRIGQIIGARYRLTHVIGEGAMGEVYRAQVLGSSGDEVAVKLLRPERSRDAEAMERFLAEVQAMRAVSHPSIARVLDAGGGTDEEGPPFVVMELLGGESLRTLLRHHGRVDRGTALAVIVPVLEALEAAHRHGVIHRDVKPENIQIRTSPPPGGDGMGPRRAQVVVLDFGIAKVVDASIAIGHHTTVGMVVGTPGYFAPEQAIGEKNIDGRVDVFAVGAVLFEMLTGQRAFDGTSPVAIAARVVNDAVPTLAELHVDAPKELQTILDRSLAKNAADRYPTARAFAQAVSELAPGELGRRILLDSWVASATSAAAAAARSDLPGGAFGEVSSLLLPSEADPDAIADTVDTLDTTDTADTADTDASRLVLGAALTATAVASPPARPRVMVNEPTMKSETDPLVAAVSARASALKPAVYIAETVAASVRPVSIAEPGPTPGPTEEDDEDDDW